MATTEPGAQVAHRVVRVQGDTWTSDDDVLAAEEPMEIRLLWHEGELARRKSIAITMRTPGDDFKLAVGFLRGEGIITNREDVLDVSYCLDEDVDQEQRLNIVSVTLRPGLAFALDLDRLERHFYTTSSCGVCGKAALEALDLQGCVALPDGLAVSAGVISSLPGLLRSAQSVFQTTGGLHAAGLFDVHGQLLDLREDVGRHNALDKLVGHQLMRGRDRLHDRVLLLSGRASFELLQKALAAGIPVVAAVGAPSSLAVSLAGTYNITLLGFVRAEGFNIYSGESRIHRTPNHPGFS